jgi:hypothetical protein
MGWILIKKNPTRCNVTQFILCGNCPTCFGWYYHPSLGAHTTVCTASIWYLSQRYCYLPLSWKRVCCGWRMPPTAHSNQFQHTVVCAPDDERWYHPKHVEQFPDKINCVTLHVVGYVLESPNDSFRFVWKLVKNDSASSCLSFHLQGNWLPMDWFSWNVINEYFLKVCQEN